MRLLSLGLLLLGLLLLSILGLYGPAVASAASNSAVPIVHIALRESASVQPDADGFFLLGAIADLSGGTAAERARISAVRIGCVPLLQTARLISHGTVALKLRQAGLDPEHGIVIEGAARASVTTADVVTTTAASRVSVPASSALPVLVHRGDPVTIVIQDDVVTITAAGIAHQDGKAGDAIRVHRDGMMDDLTVTILDAHTVQMEI